MSIQAIPRAKLVCSSLFLRSGVKIANHFFDALHNIL